MLLHLRVISVFKSKSNSRYQNAKKYFAENFFDCAMQCRSGFFPLERRHSEAVCI